MTFDEIRPLGRRGGRNNHHRRAASREMIVFQSWFLLDVMRGSSPNHFHEGDVRQPPDAQDALDSHSGERSRRQHRRGRYRWGDPPWARGSTRVSWRPRERRAARRWHTVVSRWAATGPENHGAPPSRESTSQFGALTAGRSCTLFTCAGSLPRLSRGSARPVASCDRPGVRIARGREARAGFAAHRSRRRTPNPKNRTAAAIDASAGPARRRALRSRGAIRCAPGRGRAAWTPRSCGSGREPFFPGFHDCPHRGVTTSARSVACTAPQRAEYVFAAEAIDPIRFAGCTWCVPPPRAFLEVSRRADPALHAAERILVSVRREISCASARQQAPA